MRYRKDEIRNECEQASCLGPLLGVDDYLISRKKAKSKVVADPLNLIYESRSLSPSFLVAGGKWINFEATIRQN
jgi:hypothetical protein